MSDTEPLIINIENLKEPFKIIINGQELLVNFSKRLFDYTTAILDHDKQLIA